MIPPFCRWRDPESSTLMMTSHVPSFGFWCKEVYINRRSGLYGVSVCWEVFCQGSMICLLPWMLYWFEYKVPWTLELKINLQSSFWWSAWGRACLLKSYEWMLKGLEVSLLQGFKHMLLHMRLNMETMLTCLVPQTTPFLRPPCTPSAVLHNGAVVVRRAASWQEVYFEFLHRWSGI